MASSSGRMIFAARSLRASQMPSGSPIMMQNSRAVSTSASVTIACDQAPMAPIKISDTSAATPIPALLICQAISEKTMIATGAGIPNSNCWKALKM